MRDVKRVDGAALLPELLAPAGDFDTALAAFAAGADAVYCGLSQFSARAFAKNLSPEELRNLVAYARAQSPARRVYVTFNTLIEERQLEDAVDMLAAIAEIGPDALIVQDLGVARICRRHFPALELHASTQLVAHNLEGVLALKERGFRRVVLARELSLEEISFIARRCGALRIAADGRPETELECFIHGALCYSISGLCLFGAMEKGRSGNRGTCPYCCRQPMADPHPALRTNNSALTFPFSMRDLRLGDDVLRLVDSGVTSLKIEGRMKSETYVASVTRYYRQILDRGQGTGVRGQGSGDVSAEDLETVFSRRTTKLYFDGAPSDPVLDPTSLGHLGAEIGIVKRITRDPDGSHWLRFHTSRRLEKHDGLQFENRAGGKPFGMGIDTMRVAISRSPVFEADAGEDVEILLPEAGDKGKDPPLYDVLEPGLRIYCSASQAVRRMFPVPAFRPGDYPGNERVDVSVSLDPCGVSAVAMPRNVSCRVDCGLQSAKSPEKTAEAVRQAFSRLGGTDYFLGGLSVDDPNRLFAPPRILNELRRALVERLDEARAAARGEAVSAALADIGSCRAAEEGRKPVRRLKIRAGQSVPEGEWDEVVVVMGEGGDRVATPVYNGDADFPKLRAEAKRLVRNGCLCWEASDLATLRMLRSLGVEDITADWTLYAFNSQSLRELADLGVRRFVASPENGRENLQALAESGFDVEFLAQQSTPLFISLTEPAARPQDLAVFRIGRLWVTTRPAPREFAAPHGASVRIDLSWDPATPPVAYCNK